MKRFFFYPIALVIILALVYLFVTYAPRLASSSGPSKSEVNVTSGHISETTLSYAVDAEYPQFGIQKIDDEIRKAVEDAVAEFESYPPNPADSATPQNTFDVSFDKVYVGPDVISFELVLSEYTGGAHPLTLLSGMNFDRSSGRKLTLEDALKMIGLSVQQISAQASGQFREKFGDAFFSEGADTNPENFSSFTISAEEVTFIFQQYQVAAYAAGPQSASFPRKF